MKLYEEQQVWAAHRALQNAQRRANKPAAQAPLSADEVAIIQRARGSQHPACKSGTRVKRTVASTEAVAKHVPYPSAGARTLQYLGTIDALLKAPPRPPRWVLLRILSLLEEYRERSPQLPAPAPARSLSEAMTRPATESYGNPRGDDEAARAVARRVRAIMQRPARDAPVPRRTAADLLAPEDQRRDRRRG